MKTLMLGLSMLSFFSLPSFANVTDKDCCKKGVACSSDAMKCAEDKNCLQLCKEGKCDDCTKECKDACKNEAAKQENNSKGCCKKG